VSPKRSRLAVIAGALAAAIATLAGRAPRPLPDIALASSVLFHLERGLALLAGYLAVLMVLSRAGSGQLPSELSAQGLKYESEATAQDLEAIAEGISRARDEREALLKRIETLEWKVYRDRDG
jgi:hypothetical protein